MRGNGAWACKAFISLLLVEEAKKKKAGRGAFVEHPTSISIHILIHTSTESTHSYRKDTTERDSDSAPASSPFHSLPPPPPS